MKRKNWYKKSKTRFVKQRVHTFNLSWGSNNSYSYNFLDKSESYNIVHDQDEKILKRLQKLSAHKRFWEARRLAYKNGWGFHYVYIGKKVSKEEEKKDQS